MHILYILLPAITRQCFNRKRRGLLTIQIAMSNIYTSVLPASEWSRVEHCAAQLEECWEYVFGEGLIAWRLSSGPAVQLPGLWTSAFRILMHLYGHHDPNLNLGNICLIYTVCCGTASGPTEATIKSGFLLSPHLGLYRYSKATLPAGSMLC